MTQENVYRVVMLVAEEKARANETRMLEDRMKLCYQTTDKSRNFHDQEQQRECDGRRGKVPIGYQSIDEG